MGVSIDLYKAIDDNDKFVVISLNHIDESNKEKDRKEAFDEFFVRLHYKLLPESEVKRKKRAGYFYRWAIKSFRYAANRLGEKDNDRKDLLSGVVVSDLETALKLGIKKPKVYYELGNAYRELEKFYEAINNYTQAIELDFQYAKECYFYRGDCHYARAKEFYYLGEYDKAKEYCDNAIRDFKSAMPKFEDKIYDELKNTNLLKLYSFIKKHGSITRNEYKEQFSIDQYKELEKLVKEEKLLKNKRGKINHYILLEGN